MKIRFFAWPFRPLEPLLIAIKTEVDNVSHHGSKPNVGGSGNLFSALILFTYQRV